VLELLEVRLQIKHTMNGRITDTQQENQEYVFKDYVLK
jgi:hypothetical protein